MQSAALKLEKPISIYQFISAELAAYSTFLRSYYQNNISSSTANDAAVQRVQKFLTLPLRLISEIQKSLDDPAQKEKLSDKTHEILNQLRDNIKDILVEYICSSDTSKNTTHVIKEASNTNRDHVESFFAAIKELKGSYTIGTLTALWSLFQKIGNLFVTPATPTPTNQTVNHQSTAASSPATNTADKSSTSSPSPTKPS